MRLAKSLAALAATFLVPASAADSGGSVFGSIAAMVRWANTPPALRSLDLPQSSPSSRSSIATAENSYVSLVSGALVQPLKVDVLKPPQAITTKIGFETDATGLRSIVLTYRSPSGLFAYGVYSRATGLSTGTIAVQNPLGFNVYSEPGTWTLQQVQLASYNVATSWFGTELDPYFASRSFQVLNSGTPDTAQPTITGGTIATRGVRRSNHPTMRVRMDVADDVAGATVGMACFSGNNGQGFCLQSPYGGRPVKTGTLALADQLDVVEGTYTLSMAQVSDAAGNWRTYSGEQIPALFPDGQTIVVWK